MSGADQPRAATLVVRAWHEPDDDPRLRVRVVEIPPPPAAERTLCVTTSAEEACAAVRAWLERGRGDDAVTER